MAGESGTQYTLKEIKWNGSMIVVEVAKRDGSGNLITETYATKSELTTGLAGKQATISAGTGIDFSSNVVSLKTASSSQLGGVKVGSGLSITDGVLAVTSAPAVAWSGVSSKPFSEISTNDFTVSSNVLTIKDSKFATRTWVGDNYLATGTFNTFVNTTAPDTYVAKSNFKTNYLDANNVIYQNSNISLLNNNSGFITKSVNNLDNYYKTSETYTKTEVDALISAVHQFSYESASELPTASASTMYKIYLIPSTSSANDNIKDEFITIDKGSDASPRYVWEQIGSTSVDLSAYLHSDANITTNQIVIGDGGTRKVKGSGYTIATSVENDNTSVPRNSAVYSALSGKQPTLSSSNAGNGITVTDSNGTKIIASVITATDVSLSW